MVDANEKADLVLVTHSHSDHMKKELIAQLSGPETRVLAAPKAARELGGTAGSIVPGGQAELGGIKVRAVHAYNPTGLVKFHKKGHCLGFVIETNGLRLYHAGDTGLIPEMRQLGPIDLAMVPIGGTFTMDVDEAAEAVRWIRPRVTIPMHNLRTSRGALAERLGSEYRVVVLEAGQSFTLE